MYIFKHSKSYTLVFRMLWRILFYSDFLSVNIMNSYDIYTFDFQ